MSHYDKEGNVVDIMTYIGLSSDFKYKQIGRNHIDDTLVSTIWVGSEFTRFETMVLGGEHNLYCEKWKTEEEAQAGHLKICKMVFGDDFSIDQGKEDGWT